MISETRRGFICGAAASVVTAGCRTAFSPFRRKLLVYNEDNSAYACGRKFGGPPTEAGLRDYIRRISAGGAVTHFFACPNAMRVNWDSRVMEPIWAGVDRPGAKAPDCRLGTRASPSARGLAAAAQFASLTQPDRLRRQAHSPLASLGLHFVRRLRLRERTLERQEGWAGINPFWWQSEGTYDILP